MRAGRLPCLPLGKTKATAVTILLMGLVTSCGAPMRATSFDLSSGVVGRISRIDFVTQSLGWMSILKQTPGHLLVQLFKSTNGGVSWALMMSFPGDGASGAGWFHFFSANNGVMIGSGLNQVLETSDGGRIWLSRSLPGPVLGPATLSFVNPSQAWEIITSGAGGEDQAVIYHSINGAKMWQVIARTPSITSTAPVPVGTLPLSHGSDWISFKSDLVGWATGLTAGSGYPWLYMSTNAGRSWNSQSLPLPRAWGSSEIETYNPIFTSPVDGLLPVANNSALYICRTTNGGVTWGLPVQVLPTSVSNNQNLSSFIDPQGWAFASNHDGWTVIHSSIWITTDGGQHWYRMSLASGIAQISHFAAGG